MSAYKIDEVKMREKLYRCIIGQLLNDGYMGIAKTLTSQVKPMTPCVPSDNLFKAYLAGQDQIEREKEDISNMLSVDAAAPGTGIDLEFESEVNIISPEAFLYETCYVTAHKAPCRAAAFSKNGQYIATGSVDTSIKILDVERMLAKNINPSDINSFAEPTPGVADHPVVRTLYDHVDEVTSVVFHPTAQIVISGARDYTVKIFDFTKSSAKRSTRSIKEVESVRVVEMHPTGEYILVGTNHPVIRLYGVETFQCFVGNQAADQHKSSISCIAYSPTGHVYASGSKDGAVKIWDGVSSRCVTTYIGAHSGDEICSVVFSRNGKYLLTSGKDSVARLWDLAGSGTPLLSYTGAELSGKQSHRAQALFNHTEDYVFFPDEQTVSMCCWCSRTGERQRLLALGHQGPARRIIHSPNVPAFMSCSEDHRARFWTKKLTTD